MSLQSRDVASYRMIPRPGKPPNLSSFSIFAICFLCFHHDVHCCLPVFSLISIVFLLSFHDLSLIFITRMVSQGYLPRRAPQPFCGRNLVEQLEDGTAAAAQHDLFREISADIRRPRAVKRLVAFDFLVKRGSPRPLCRGLWPDPSHRRGRSVGTKSLGPRRASSEPVFGTEMIENEPFWAEKLGKWLKRAETGLECPSVHPFKGMNSKPAIRKKRKGSQESGSQGSRMSGL